MSTWLRRINIQWRSQNTEKVTHIKGRLLDQAVILINCVACIDIRSMDGRIYVSDHKTYIYKLCVSPFQRRRFKVFPIISISIYTPEFQSNQPKNHMQPFPFHTWWCFICNFTRIGPLDILLWKRERKMPWRTLEHWYTKTSHEFSGPCQLTILLLNWVSILIIAQLIGGEGIAFVWI